MGNLLASIGRRKKRSLLLLNDAMPDELLGLIFHHLDNPEDLLHLERVCRRWNRLAWTYGWTGFKTFDTGKDRGKGMCYTQIRPFLQLTFPRCGLYIQELSFTWKYIFPPRSRGSR